MTWTQALEVADEQIAHWQHHGIDIDDVEDAILAHAPNTLRWQTIRHWLAAWTYNHAKEGSTM